MYTISVDSGKATTKWCAYKKGVGAGEKPITGVFPTVIKPLIGQSQFGRIENKVRYNGQLYSVGDAKDVKEVPMESCKLKAEHEICIYTAIAKALKALGANLNQTQSVNLALNVPLRDFKLDEKRAQYEDKYFQKDNHQTVSITLDDQVINFIISDLTLCYEGQGSLIEATLAHPEMKLDEGFVLLCDLGGCNSSVLLFEDWEPVMNRNGAPLYGVLGLFRDVSFELSDRYETEVTIRDVELLSKGEHLKEKAFPHFEEVYSEKARQLLVNIRTHILRQVINKHTTTFCFAGGGSRAVAPFIQEAFADVDYIILDDAQFANCKGMLELTVSENEGE